MNILDDGSFELGRFLSINGKLISPTPGPADPLNDLSSQVVDWLSEFEPHMFEFINKVLDYYGIEKHQYSIEEHRRTFAKRPDKQVLVGLLVTGMVTDEQLIHHKLAPMEGTTRRVRFDELPDN